MKKLLTLLLLCSLSILAYADFDSALAAYDAGDYETAFKEFLPLAEEGNDEAQKSLGYLYIQGLGVAQDYGEAFKWFRKAAEQGNAGAQETLGFLYREGLGVTQDYAEAAKWYRKAAEQGLPLAEHNLGWMYQQGLGVQRDYAEAFNWYRKAPVVIPLPAVDESHTSVIVLREKQFINSLVSSNVALDEIPIVELRTGQYTSFQVEKGCHTLTLYEDKLGVLLIGYHPYDIVLGCGTANNLACNDVQNQEYKFYIKCKSGGNHNKCMMEKMDEFPDGIQLSNYTFVETVQFEDLWVNTIQRLNNWKRKVRNFDHIEEPLNLLLRLDYTISINK